MKKLTTLLIIVLISLIALTSCNNNNNNNDINEIVGDAGLVGVWHHTGYDVATITFVFHDNGVGVMFTDLIYWSAEDGTITWRPMDDEDDYRTYTYTLDGDSLTITAPDWNDWTANFARGE